MPGAVYLRGDGLTLRTIEEDDLEFLRDTINDPDVRHHLPNRVPYTLAQEEEYFENVVCDDENVQLLVCADGDRVGTIGLHPADSVSGTGELGIFLAKAHWGRGLGTEASRVMTEYAFAERRLHRVTARVLEGNHGSRQIWEKLGFRHEATLRDADFIDGEYVDVHWYAILEDEWDGGERANRDG